MLSSPSRSSAWIVFVAGVLITSTAAWSLRNQETSSIQAGFDAEVHEQEALILERLGRVLAGNDHLRALLRANQGMDAATFNEHVEVLVASEPAVLGMSWNAVVEPADRAAFEAQLRAQGNEDFRVVARDDSGELVAPPADERVVVMLFNESSSSDPGSSECGALGFDLRSFPDFQEAIDAAVDTRQFAVSEPLTYSSERPDDLGTYAFQWFETQTEGPESGFLVTTLIQLAPMVNGALVSLGIPAGEAYLVYGRGSDSMGLIRAAGPTDTAASSPDLDVSLDPEGDGSPGFDWGGLRWRLVVAPPSGYIQARRSGVPATIAIAGLLIFGLLATRLRRVDLQGAKRTEALVATNASLAETVHTRTSELQDATHRLSTLLHTEPECVKIVDSQGRLREMNPAGLAMVEAGSLEEVHLASVYDLVMPHDRDKFIDLNERVCAGEAMHLEFEIQGLQGTRRHMETSAVPIEDPDGEGYLHLAVTRDVTERRRIQEERLELEGKLRDKQRIESLGTLAGGIAHDFNNLLHVITGRCEHALDDASLSAGVRESVGAIAAAGAEGARLCDQLLTYLGQAQAEREVLLLSKVVEQLGGLLDLSHPSSVDLSLSLTDQEVWIEADAGQLNQVLLNLVTNASEAIGDRPGRIDVRVDSTTIAEAAPQVSWIDEEPPAGRYARLRVRDDGDGIRPEALAKIFDPFFTTKFTGRGLGLASCLGIVRGHHGFLSVSSQPGVGAEFTILLPRVEAPVVELTPNGPSGPKRLAGETVLVVDDETSVLRVSAKLLNTLGLETIETSSGAEAIAQFQACHARVDVALIDWTMPGMDGLTTLNELRSIDPELPAVLCSGYSDDAVGDRVAGLARVAFLQKPFSRDQLAAAIETVLRAPSGVAR